MQADAAQMSAATELLNPLASRQPNSHACTEAGLCNETIRNMEIPSMRTPEAEYFPKGAFFPASRPPAAVKSISKPFIIS